MPDYSTTSHTYTRPAYSVWLICTEAGAAMTRKTVRMWEKEVHVGQGGKWVEEPGS